MVLFWHVTACTLCTVASLAVTMHVVYDIFTAWNESKAKEDERNEVDDDDEQEKTSCTSSGSSCPYQHNTWKNNSKNNSKNSSKKNSAKNSSKNSSKNNSKIVARENKKGTKMQSAIVTAHYRSADYMYKLSPSEDLFYKTFCGSREGFSTISEDEISGSEGELRRRKSTKSVTFRDVISVSR